MKKLFALLLALVLTLSLAACGGGSGESAPPAGAPDSDYPPAGAVSYTHQTQPTKRIV